MLKRKVMTFLEKWKRNPEKKSLLISGARQVGKTFIVRRFAEANYTSFIELNFLEDPSLTDIFSGALDWKSILTNIRLVLPQQKVISGETLLFLDEIQECPQAVTALKFLTQEKSIDVIASGSALGISYKQAASFPVGAVDYLDMTSLDFEEFLWAMQIDGDVLSDVQTFFTEKKAVPPGIHRKMTEYLRQYMVIGGMPEVVQKFADTQSYLEADMIQRNIYRSYITDIAHYAPPDVKIKAEKCYKTIPLQLTKENHKFQYKTVESKGTARKFETSIDWLVNAYMAYPVCNVSAVEYPLKAHVKEDNFRIYMNDIGLLISTYDYEMKNVLLHDGMLEEKPENLVMRVAKGGLYEALAADILLKSGKELYFYRNDAGTIELEFFFETAEGIIPVEIKAGKSSTASLNRILEIGSIPYGYKLSSQNVGVSGKKITLPLYMLMFL